MGRKRHVIPYDTQGQHPSSLHLLVKLFPNNDRAPLASFIPRGSFITLKKHHCFQAIAHFFGGGLFYNLPGIWQTPQNRETSSCSPVYSTQERGRAWGRVKNDSISISKLGVQPIHDALLFATSGVKFGLPSTVDNLCSCHFRHYLIQ